MYRLVSKKETHFRLEQVVWKECMLLAVVNTTFFILTSSGVTGSSKTMLPSAECFSKVCPAGTWQDCCSHGFQDRTDPSYLRATGKALTWTGFFCSTESPILGGNVVSAMGEQRVCCA